MFVLIIYVRTYNTPHTHTHTAHTHHTRAPHMHHTHTTHTPHTHTSHAHHRNHMPHCIRTHIRQNIYMQSGSGGGVIENLHSTIVFKTINSHDRTLTEQLYFACLPVAWVYVVSSQPVVLRVIHLTVYM